MKRRYVILFLAAAAIRLRFLLLTCTLFWIGLLPRAEAQPSLISSFGNVGSGHAALVSEVVITGPGPRTLYFRALA